MYNGHDNHDHHDDHHHQHQHHHQHHSIDVLLAVLLHLHLRGGSSVIAPPQYIDSSPTADLHHYIYTGCFFNWYPPKKYGKPRLSESTAT